GVPGRIFIIWAISSWFRRGTAPQEPNGAGGSARSPSRNLFPKDTLMHFTDFNLSSALFWEKRDLVYGDWTSGENSDGCYEHFGEVDISQSVQRNGSIYVHVYFTKSGFHPDPRQKSLYRRLATVHTSRSTQFPGIPWNSMEIPILGNPNPSGMAPKPPGMGFAPILTQFPPIFNRFIAIFNPFIPIFIKFIPISTQFPPISHPISLSPDVKFDALSGDYFPILYFNDYWNLQRDYFPINESVRRLPLRLSFCPLSLWRWQLYAAQSSRSPWNFLADELLEQSDDEQDSVKVALLETNPYLLALTIIVSIVHSIFEFLAFKNDIQFWNSRQSLEGLSVRSVFFGVFQSLVVLLYILDNETNVVVQLSVLVGLLIDLWKITKVMDVRMAFRYLSWLLFPLLGCYAVYSLLYLEHKGWYSWLLGMLYGFLLTFG
ncbi:CLPT1 protein, partial [Poecile atricapillus]|nr:CLPT1 protein [Poecile atricapillus]